jgi:hypothetical protein
MPEAIRGTEMWFGTAFLAIRKMSIDRSEGRWAVYRERRRSQRYDEKYNCWDQSNYPHESDP